MSKRPSKPQHSAAEHLPKRLRDATGSASTIYAASPYVTCQRLFRDYPDGADARVYLDFSAIHFISGASSLKVLKKLCDSGVKLYSVPHLHAKVVLIDQKHFSVGSQNLTVRGRRTNLEASFIAGSTTPPQEVMDFFTKLHTQATPIDAADLDQMQTLVAPWIRKFRGLEKAGKDRALSPI